MTTITSTTNQRVKWIRQLQSSRAARHEELRFVIEGARLLQEALAASTEIPLVLHNDEPDDETEQLLTAFAQRGAEVIAASDEVLQSCSDTETSQGLLAVASLPKVPKTGSFEPILIADRLRDPGNLGTLMRSALAAGVQLLLLTPGTVDPLNPKVVRGAMGAHFHLPLKWIEIDELEHYMELKKLMIAEANRGERYDRVDWTQACMLLIGSEAHGPSSDVLKFEHEHVHIPIGSASESLNAAVAGSIMLFELARQRGF